MKKFKPQTDQFKNHKSDKWMLKPSLNTDWPQKDHAHARYGCWRGAAQVVGLKQEVNIWAKLDTLPTGHG